MGEKNYKELAVYGFKAVLALINENPEKISRLFFTKYRAKAFGKICKFLANQKKIYRIVSDQELEKLSQSLHHQGVVAMIFDEPVPRLEHDQIYEWAKNKESVLVLDEIGNANNRGAIIRSAAFFGIKNIVITKEDKQSLITPATYRVAEGGMEFVNIYSISSAAWFLRQCQGKLTTIGTAIDAHYNLVNINRFLEENEPAVVVLGNEERGMSNEAKKLCTHLIKIPGSGDIESLNVAQAASILCYTMSSR